MIMNMNIGPLALGKCLQTPVQEPALVWPLKKSKSFLVVSAHPRRAGVFLALDKLAGATANGNLATVIRTWGGNLAVKSIWFDEPHKTWWIPVGADALNPRAYVQLLGGSAPEITLIECAPKPCVRMRFSTAGVFTKRRGLDFDLPHQMPADRRQKFIDILPGLLSPQINVAHAALDLTSPANAMLPLYQREGRDKLTRRLKTLRKALANQEKHAPEESAVLAARAHAAQLQTEGRGREIDDAFKELKRLERSAVDAGRHVGDVRTAVAAAEEALAQLRGGEMAEIDVAAILSRHGIKAQAVSGKVRDSGSAASKTRRPVASDWYDFTLSDGTRIMVGKGAEENDRLVKGAAANDWWFHAVGVTGSHVIVPGRQFKGLAELPPHVLRAAGILAIHYSKLRESRAGEVYMTRKAHLRKRKGDPAGLWQVSRSGSVQIRYEPEELAGVYR